MLLIYDGYRSHLGIAVLENLSNAGVIAYALLSHTSGTIQQLGLLVFPVFKARFRTICQELTVECGVGKVFDEFDVCKTLTRAYIVFSHLQTLLKVSENQVSVFWIHCACLLKHDPYLSRRQAVSHQ